MVTDRELTRQQALAWRPWPSGDLRIINEQMDRTGAVRFFETKGYVKCRDGNDKPLFDLHPGYIDFKVAQIPNGLRPGSSWLTLSTFDPKESSDRSELTSGQVCTTCGIEFSLDGNCGC